LVRALLLGVVQAVNASVGRKEELMEKHPRKPRSLGDLIVSVYDEAAKATDDVHLAAKLTAREVTRGLIKSGRPDLALELANGLT
jgi:hypothetical protein